MKKSTEDKIGNVFITGVMLCFVVMTVILVKNLDSPQAVTPDLFKVKGGLSLIIGWVCSAFWEFIFKK